MVWYIKYPVLAIGALLLFGCLYLAWEYVPESWRSRLTGNPVPVAASVAVPAAAETQTAPAAPVAVPAVAVSAPAEKTEKTDKQPAAAAPAVPTVEPAAALQPTAALQAKELRMLEQRLVAAEEQLHKDNLAAARSIAEKALESPAIKRFEADWFRAVEVISKANSVFINSDAPAPEKTRYVIQPGDTLISIANHFQTTVTAIERGNKLDTTRISLYPGMVISIYPAKWALEAIKTRFVLILYDGERIFKLYRVGIGRQNRTPVGVFKVNSKLREPVWTPPGKVIPYGDPANVLGTRWLGIQPIEDTDTSLKGFGIHGTWQPESVGTAASEGCIRLKNEDVNELFDIVPIGTRVTIKDE